MHRTTQRNEEEAGAGLHHCDLLSCYMKCTRFLRSATNECSDRCSNLLCLTHTRLEDYCGSPRRHRPRSRGRAPVPEAIHQASKADLMNRFPTPATRDRFFVQRIFFRLSFLPLPCAFCPSAAAVVVVVRAGGQIKSLPPPPTPRVFSLRLKRLFKGTATTTATPRRPSNRWGTSGVCAVLREVRLFNSSPSLSQWWCLWCLLFGSCGGTLC